MTSSAPCQDLLRRWPYRLLPNVPATTSLLFHTSGYINVSHLIPIDMARGQAKSNIHNNLPQPPVPKDQGEVYRVRISGCLR